MENCLPFTYDVKVVLVHKYVQQTHLLTLHLETGYIPRLLNALNGLIYFLIIGGPRGDNHMVGNISQIVLTELGIRTEDALMLFLFFCYAFVSICLLMPCGHLLGKG